jgi:hypothetical protein
MSSRKLELCSWRAVDETAQPLFLVEASDIGRRRAVAIRLKAARPEQDGQPTSA